MTLILQPIVRLKRGKSASQVEETQRDTRKKTSQAPGGAYRENERSQVEAGRSKTA